MKLNKLFLVALMGLSLNACNKNDLSGNTTDNPQAEKSTYVAFSLKFNETNTRAEATNWATEEESKITSAYVILSDNGKITAIVDHNTAATTDGKYIFQTVAGNHDFYAIINPDTPPTVGANISDYFNSGQKLNKEEISNANNFMMSSCEKKTFNVNNNVTKEQAKDGNKDEPATNNFTIAVERVASKITMTCLNPALASENNDNSGGTISNLQYFLMGEAQSSYRMATTPNLNLKREDEGIKDFYDMTTNPIGTIIEIGEDKDKTKAKATYCLENLQDDYKQGNTTYIILKTNFIPKKVVDCTNGTVIENDNTNTPESFVLVKSGALAGNYIIEKDLEAYKNAHDGNLPQGVQQVSTVYTNGECWFGPIWIGQKDNQDPTGPVKRNTWYNLNITTIKLPGSPSAPAIDKEESLIPDTHVAITLDILDWATVDRNINLQ